MRYYIRSSLFILIAVIFYSADTLAEAHLKAFKTKYTTVYYTCEKDMNDFIWRLGGTMIEFPADKRIALHRIDRIVERVETILDMYPKNFNVKITLRRGALEPNQVAFYEHKTKSIYISVDYASDGVLAHEVAHAIISQYFPIPTSSKIQEILTQYVDKYLWSDY